jgi:beta-N-acetylhexosaminidase
MSLGPLMVDIAGTELTAEDVRVLTHPLVGSVLLFTRNYSNPQQVAALTGAIRGLRTPHLLIAVDQEGGRVQRFRDGFTRLPPVRLLGRAYDRNAGEALAFAQSLGWLMAAELRAVGVDFSFAPCVDLDYGVSEIIGDRAFHSDPDRVAALAVALPVDRRGFADLEADMRPYRPLIENNLAGIMAAHVVFPGVDALPASLSRHWITGILRGELGFHGCVFADDLSMAGAAAFGDVIARSELALAAGCDVLPICNDRHSVELVLGRLAADAGSAASQARLVRMRGRGEVPADLHSSRHWQETAAKIASLSTPPPPLVLTEGQS